MEQFPIDQIKCGFVKGVASANGSTESRKASDEGSDLGGKMKNYRKKTKKAFE